jgi:hypothetical protein
MDNEELEQEITDEQYAIWLDRYGAIFMFHHLGENYIYRRLSRREYKAVLAIENELDRTEEVVQSCLLYPANWRANSKEVQYGLAGIPEAICEQILKASGAIEMSQVLTGYKNIVSSEVEAQMESVIDHVFAGGARFGKYQDWSHDQLFEAYARAEWILINIGGKQIQAQQQQTPAEAKPRPIRSKEELQARREELQRIHEEQMKGSAAKTGVDGLIDSFSSGQMALRPMTEVVQKYEKAQKRRQVMEKIKKDR